MAKTAEQPRERFTNFTPYEMKKGEDYMSAEMLQHFKDLLLQWKQELMEEVDRTMHHMQEDAANYADPSDRATQEEEFSLELRTRDRERKLHVACGFRIIRLFHGVLHHAAPPPPASSDGGWPSPTVNRM